MVSFQASGSPVGSGGCPLLRMKNLGVGVVSSSSSCSGVSATSGLSPNTTRPASLPGKLSLCGPFGAGAEAAAGASCLASCAKAAGISPPGMVAPNTIGPPTAALMAASPAPPRKPRRETPVARSNTSALTNQVVPKNNANRTTYIVSSSKNAAPMKKRSV